MNVELTYLKKADNGKNRIVIPKWFIDKYGRDLYVKINGSKILITPVKKPKA